MMMMMSRRKKKLSQKLSSIENMTDRLGDVGSLSFGGERVDRWG